MGPGSTILATMFRADRPKLWPMRMRSRGTESQACRPEMTVGKKTPGALVVATFEGRRCPARISPGGSAILGIESSAETVGSRAARADEKTLKARPTAGPRRCR